jgi:hypothetical protein
MLYFVRVHLKRANTGRQKKDSEEGFAVGMFSDRIHLIKNLIQLSTSKFA